MRATFRKSFARDLRKISDQQVLHRVKQKIEEVEAAARLGDVTDVVKISGHSGYFRIRVGDHRLGVVVDGEEMNFVRCLNRRDIYRYFP